MDKLKLEKNALESRSFLIQFKDIQNEFGHEIPWLEGTEDLPYILNEKIFVQELVKGLVGESGEHMEAYLLHTDDIYKRYIGGLLHFKKCPENFQDSENRKIQEELTDAGVDYISCLQVRESFQKNGYGDLLFKEALKAIFNTKESVWGVVSHPELLPWYQRNGAKVLQDIDNKDQLAIVQFESKNMK